MSIDPMLGGASVELDGDKAYSQRDLSQLGSGGIRDRHKPETTVTQKFAARPGLNSRQQVQAPIINREMIIAGYKGNANAWLRCLHGVLQANGQQVDRRFYLALDPRESDRQGELMEIGRQAFSEFVVVPYRDFLEANPVGLPAARNLHSFVGKITEEFRNVGPVLVALPFFTLIPGAFDVLERNYEHATRDKKISFMGYEVKKADGRRPGATLVLPPNWSRHPDFPLAKGLSPFANGDIEYIKDEILRSLRASDTIVGHGMKAGPSCCIQTFPADQIVSNVEPAFNPAGRPSVPTSAPNNPQSLPLTSGLVVPQEAKIGQVALLPFGPDEKESALSLISQLGMQAIKIMDAGRYGLTLADDPEFAEATVKKAQGWKIKAGKAAKVK
jgi:hypothetical protein